MRKFGAIFVFVICFLVSKAVYADIDQHCLKQCVEGGVASSVCLTQCSYNIPMIDPTVKTPPQTHRILATPQPLEEGEVILPPKIIHPLPNKDYPCMAQCVQNGGMVYHACEERCTIQPCVSGVALCHNPTSAPTAAAPVAPNSVNAMPPSYR